MDKTEVNNKPIKNRKTFKDFLPIIVIILSVIAIAIEGVIYYQRSYLTPFWVNGQSMFPTLNGDALDAQGRPLVKSSGSAYDGYTVDYGVMDTHEGAINKIKRFDIIITKYGYDDKDNKIKRVLGLPGETIRFTVTGKRQEHNGDLYINDVFVEQPIDSEFIKEGDKYPSYNIQLGEDEYYVCGDNRGYSTDSRDNGPIKKDFIEGKAVAICGTGIVYSYEVDEEEDGVMVHKIKKSVKDIKYHWPRYL